MRIDRFLWVRLVVLGGLLGVLTTIGVAWLLARSQQWDALGNEYRLEPPAGPAMVTTYSRTGSEMVAVFGLPGQFADTHSPRDLDWSRARRDGLGSGLSLEAAHGWPLLCLRWSAVRAASPSPGPGTRVRWGLTITPGDFNAEVVDKRIVKGRFVISRRSQVFSKLGEYVLPLRPLWWRFAVDCVCYALAWCAPLAVAVLLLWRSRRRRGRCPCCGYPVRGVELCPECGRPAQEDTNISRS